MKTLLLNPTTWDLMLDANGNIAVADEPYALAQDVASAVKTFLGECWYDTTLGVPYFGQILGQRPPMSLVKAQLVKAAMTVPGVVSARCIITSFDNRTISGQIQFTDSTGTTNNVNF